MLCECGHPEGNHATEEQAARHYDGQRVCNERIEPNRDDDSGVPSYCHCENFKAVEEVPVFQNPPFPPVPTECAPNPYRDFR